MRTAVWISVGAAPLLVGSAAYQYGRLPLLELGSEWWAFPLLASALSTFVLAAFTTLGARHGSRIPTPAYLVAGVAFGCVNLLPALIPVPSPPRPIGWLMPGLLLVSAWLYFRATGEPSPGTVESRTPIDGQWMADTYTPNGMKLGKDTPKMFSAT